MKKYIFIAELQLKTFEYIESYSKYDFQCTNCQL